MAFLALLWMGWIDLKLWILPNELVFLYGLMALPFHISLGWLYGGWLYFLLGGMLGCGILLLIRGVANRLYKMETMGLGDIKLLTAAGLWLGPQGVILTLAVGSFCGAFHAISLALLRKRSLKRMMLPAGPGFIAGIILVSFWIYKDLLL